MSFETDNQDKRNLVGMVADEYDSGLLSDFGGGNVEWWQDYIRSEVGAANEFHMDQDKGDNMRNVSFFHTNDTLKRSNEDCITGAKDIDELRAAYKYYGEEYERVEATVKHFKFMQGYFSNEIIGAFRYLGKEYKDKEKIRELYTAKLDEFLDIKEETDKVTKG